MIGKLKCDLCDTAQEEVESEYNEFKEWINSDIPDEPMHFCYNCESIVQMILDKQITPK